MEENAFVSWIVYGESWKLEGNAVSFVNTSKSKR